MDADTNNVKVAIRIRPQVSAEILQKCSICTTVTPNEPQIWLGSDKAFTFDHVFDISTVQQAIYDSCVQNLVEGCFEGYNATVLAYGQTGSGKTYTMGTGFDMLGESDQRGIIPRAIQHLFSSIERRTEGAKSANQIPPDIKVSVQFLELYNEEIIDLLNDDRGMKNQIIKIHEDPAGGIYTVGATAKVANSADVIFQCLKKGALSRQTGSTNMNVQSSRSHAIFTIMVKQQRIVPSYQDDTLNDQNMMSNEIQEFETLSAKFHFVDLAGSERLKRTGATGDRAKEGISINSGLLALGNVISALGDRTKKSSHVPYRDSKLTRLLQDSLGGNSRTLMIACISPSDRDFMETLSTLRYANRAKNIRNKVLANQDKSSQTISLLRKQIADLEVELQEYRQGKRIINNDGTEQINDMYHENKLLKAEVTNLKTRLKALQDTHDQILAKNAKLLAQQELGDWKEGHEMGELVEKYFQEIEQLRSKLIEAEETSSQLRKQINKQNRLSMSPYHNSYGGFSMQIDDSEDILSKAREELKRERANLKRKLKKNTDDTIENNNQQNNEQLEADESEEADENSSNEDQIDEELNSSAADESENEEESTEDKLAHLADEITIKEKLMFEIEKSQKKVDLIMHTYEEKLKTYHEKVKQMENERDQVLAKLESQADKASAAESALKVREKYEKKLATLQNQLRKLQEMHKRHDERSRSKFDSQLRSIKTTIEDLKRQKVKLMNKMKEDNQRFREIDRKNTKKIIQLTKQERVKDVKIRNLEKETIRYKSLLKRKDNEVLHLKKRIRPINEKVNGRINTKAGQTLMPPSRLNTTITKIQASELRPPYSPKIAKNKWQNLQQTISKIIMDKQKIASQEHLMERYLCEREQLSKMLDRLHRKLEQALQSNKDETIIGQLHDEIENCEANIKYLNQNLNECQSVIMAIEEQRDEHENLDFHSLLSDDSEEVHYLFEKLLNCAVHNGILAQQKEDERREFELKYKQVANSSMIQEEMLHHFVESNLLDKQLLSEIKEQSPDDEQIPNGSALKVDVIPPSPPQHTINGNSDDHHQVNHNNNHVHKKPTQFHQTESKNVNGTISASIETTYDSLIETNHLAKAEEHIARFEQLSKKTNAERLSIGDDLRPVANGNTSYSSTASTSPNRSNRRITMLPVEILSETSIMEHEEKMTQSLNAHSDAIQEQPESKPISRVPSAPSLKDVPNRLKMEISPSTKRRPIGFANNQLSNNITRQISGDLSESTPPSSPPSHRRLMSRDDNVFNRLTSNMNHHNTPNTGIINDYNGKSAKSSYLACISQADGHSRPVLSIVATNELMISGSKDGTAKIWDLGVGKEIQSLREHPDSVVCVRYNEHYRTVFTVSKCFIKVWDIRENSAKCIKTLSSNGMSEFTLNGRMEGPSEPRINDIQLANNGKTLFSTCSQFVRVWDLRQYYAVSKLNTSHQSNITCLTAEDRADRGCCVVTGSKDHYLKAFELGEQYGSCVSPRFTLDPPHLDGISSMAMQNQILFSASRDGCIKQWDLTGRNYRILNTNHNAHKDSVLSLHLTQQFNYSGNYSSLLVSACKDGRIKLWDSSSFTQIAEVQAHQAAVHSICSNASFIFTGSSDHTIGMWKRRTSNDQSPDNNEELAHLPAH